MSPPDTSGLSRRRFIQLSGAGLGTAALAGSSALVYDESASRAATPAAGSADLVDTVLEAFQTYRLVGIGEVHHLQNHHDVLEALLTDPRIPAVVDDIVIEFGNAHYQATIDRFISGEPVDNTDLRPVWRNTTQSPAETWDQPVYEQFFRTVRAANWALPASQQMRVLLGDPSLSWPTIKHADQFAAAIQRRDTFPATLIEQEVLANGRRALICYGMSHLFHAVNDARTPPNLATLVQQRTGQKTYTIADLAPLKGDPGGLATKLLPYSRNTVIPTTNTWLGTFDAGLCAQLFSETTKGRTVNPYCGVPLGSVIDAGLYLGQPHDLTLSYWNPAIFLDSTYWTELHRRNAINHAVSNQKLRSYRTEQPAPFPLLNEPHYAECGAA